MNGTVSYGSGNSVTRNWGGQTVGEVLASARPILGFGDNVEGFIDNVPQNNGTRLVSGFSLTVRDKSCTKAV